MFNDDFFPTPDAVIEKMLAPLYVPLDEERHYGLHSWRTKGRALPYSDKTICDPSAGSGAILDYLAREFDEQSYGGHMKTPKKLYCFETDPTLQATLQGKNYRLLGHDFLKYSGDMPISLMVMNPPFSNGDLHVLHAYKVVAPGGQVVALVNSETLRNPYTRTRQMLASLIEQVNGVVEELGQCFLDSERPTEVEVSIIRLQKPMAEDRFNFDWHNVSRERGADTQKEHASELMGRDVIGVMLTQYDCLREQFMALLRAIDGIRHYGAGLSMPRSTRDAWRIARDIISDSKERPDYKEQYLCFTEQMRQEIWQVVLDKVDIQKFMTHNVRENFAKYSEQQGYMDFTRENVGHLISMVLNNTGNILEVAIGQLFDKFTQYHYENRCHVEGWKTNSRYKVNRKLILPNWVEFSEYGNFSLDWRHRSHYEDVDKVMCYLTGEKHETTVLIRDVLEAKFRELGRVASGPFDGYCESHFFKIRFFKKGTIHLEFKDMRLWQEFNLRACAGKTWLPAEEMQAYQRRTASPFQKAQPAPDTAHAEMAGNPALSDLLKEMLGPAADRPALLAQPGGTAQVVLTTEATADTLSPVEEAVMVVTPEPVVVLTPKPEATPVLVPVVTPAPSPARGARSKDAGQLGLFDPLPLAA